MTAAYCTGCGQATAECRSGGMCRGRYEPLRYCPDCGRRLRVVIIPTGWTASCRDHGPVVDEAAPTAGTGSSTDSA
jgi:hypothetical protein